MLAIVMALSIIGCGSIINKMNRLSINMSKDDVRSLFGNTFISKASKVDKNGNVLDLWEFNDKKTKSTYQIYFLNNKVSQWGKAEDLKTFPELYTTQSKESAKTEVIPAAKPETPPVTVVETKPTAVPETPSAAPAQTTPETKTETKQ